MVRRKDKIVVGNKVTEAGSVKFVKEESESLLIAEPLKLLIKRIKVL
jgi:hypothetical protein